MNKHAINDLDKVKHYVKGEYFIYMPFRRDKLNEVPVRADNFTDSAMGQAYLGDGNTLVLRMDRGYSYLYIEHPNYYQDSLIEEMPTKKECNEIAKLFGYKFI